MTAARMLDRLLGTLPAGLLLRDKRTWGGRVTMSAYDPKRTRDDFRPERSHLRGVIFALRECESDRVSAMRSQTPPLAPGEPAFDVTVQIVLNDFGPLGRVYRRTHFVKICDARPIIPGIDGEPVLAIRVSREQPWA
jgi:hypothetical protein